MTKEEAIKYLIKPVATSTEIGEEKQKEFEAYDMAIEALQFVKHFDLLKEYQSLQEVVRCKNCKHFQNEHICQYFSRFGTIETSAYAYCAYGERREL